MNKRKFELSRFVFASIAGLVLAVLATAGWLAQPGSSSAADGEPDSSITICKKTDPASTGDLIDFDTDIPGMEDADLADGDCMTQGELEAGKYEITEDKSTNWTVVDIVCNGTDATNVEVDLAKHTVKVTLEKGEDVTCTFFNFKEPTPTATPEDTATPTDVPTDTPENTPTNTPVNTPTDVPAEPTVAPPTPTEMPTDMPEEPVALPDAGAGFGPDLVLSWYWYALVGALLLIGLGVLIRPSYD